MNLNFKQIQKLKSLVWEVVDASDFEYQDESYQKDMKELHSEILKEFERLKPIK